MSLPTRYLNLIFALAFVIVAIFVAGCTDTGTLPQSAMTPTTPQMPANGSPVPAEKLVAFVEKAYEYAHEHGQDAALREYNNNTGQFVEGELYIFAYDTRGNTLALPFQPGLIGKNRWNVTDANGTAFIREIVKTAQSGGGFVHYLYSDPSDNFKNKTKLSFVMMVDQDWVIGSGTYLQI